MRRDHQRGRLRAASSTSAPTTYPVPIRSLPSCSALRIIPWYGIHSFPRYRPIIARRTLVERWNSRLAENELLLRTGSQQMRWLRRMYVRIYRFLVSVYGSDDNTVSLSEDHWEDARDEHVSHMPFVDNTTDQDGLRPKSAARIRAALKKVHAANNQAAAPGPLREISKEDWVTVATWSRFSCIMQEGIRALNEKGITVRQVWQGDRASIQVSYRSFDEATAALHVVRKYHPRPQWVMLGKLRLYRTKTGTAGEEAGFFQLLGVIFAGAFVVPMVAILAVIRVAHGLGRSEELATNFATLTFVLVWIIVACLALSFFMWHRRATRIFRPRS